MKQLTIKAIENIENVREFFTFLLVIDCLNFHPDDLMTDYINSKPFYTLQEAHERQKLLTECFTFCAKANIDIYDIAFDMINERHQQEVNTFTVNHIMPALGIDILDAAKNQMTVTPCRGAGNYWLDNHWLQLQDKEYTAVWNNAKTNIYLYVNGKWLKGQTSDYNYQQS